MTFDPTRAVTIRHMYYHDPEKFDLQKMREEAYKHSQGDKFNKPEAVIIHHHAKETPCSQFNVLQHEEYQPREVSEDE